MQQSNPMLGLSRRSILNLAAAGLGSVILPRCTTADLAPPARNPALSGEPGLSDYALMYGPVVDEGFALPAIPYKDIDPQFLRQVVAAPPGLKSGMIAIDTDKHHLYLIRPDGTAIRYGVGLGRAGFEWQGRAVVQWKQKWPTWTPPAEMIARDPKLAKYGPEAGGQPGGPANPLGARAHYLFRDGKDTLYRIHGSPEWNSIGKSVSSGCVRMMNQDVIDLYNRVPNSTPVAVGSGAEHMARVRQKGNGLAIDAGVPQGAVKLETVE